MIFNVDVTDFDDVEVEECTGDVRIFNLKYKL
jgi:hypothetical protein